MQTKDTYRAAHGNYISAKQQFEKVDSDLSQSRAQVEKVTPLRSCASVFLGHLKAHNATRV